MSLRQRVYEALSNKDTPENFQEIRYSYIAKNNQEKRSKDRRSTKDELSVKKKNKRKGNKTKNKQRIALAKKSGPDQNAINLSCLNLTSP